MIRGLWIRDADLVDVHLLRTFVAVAECLSFSGAARRLGYTQSAVSQHIALLENDLGVTLLHRRPVGLTPAGERLLEHTGPILLRLDAARADVLRSVGEPPGELLLAASPLAVSERVAAVLALLRRARPGLEVTLVVTGREAVITGVATGDFPLGLVDGVAAPSDPLRLSGSTRCPPSPWRSGRSGSSCPARTRWPGARDWTWTIYRPPAGSTRPICRCPSGPVARPCATPVPTWAV
jgi:DNA-binding transcriptional LysR family regulator